MEAEATLRPATSGFVLSAAITILFNTGLAWAKDVFPALNAWMKSVGGHHWTTHGLFDLALFAALGLVLMKTRVAERLSARSLTAALTGAVVIAALGLAVWYVFV